MIWINIKWHMWRLSDEIIHPIQNYRIRQHHRAVMSQWQSHKGK